MKYLNRFLFLSVIAFLFCFSIPAFAQTPAPNPAITPKEEVSKAKILRIINEGEKNISGQKHPYQKIELQILDGPEKDKKVTITHGDQTTLRKEQKVNPGQTIILLKTTSQQRTTYAVIDKYRLDKLVPLVILFLAVVLLISRLKGLGALVGLAVSFAVIIHFIVPSILAGEDPLVTSIIGSFFIMVTTIYVAHGFSQKTHIALLATSIALILTGLLSYLFVNLTFLTGLGSEDATSLQFGQTGMINFQGLLLGGIIIGSLGALDDITTGLSASIQELTKANPNLTFRHLVSSGMKIGSEHIASLVNTLALAYAGAGLPLFLFIVLNPTNQPLWLILNSELLVEEIVRTLAGSIGLILAVPLTAILAAWAFQKK